MLNPSVGAKGDPHLQNMRGERFDLLAPGLHALLHIPKASSPEETLVRVEADARGLGGACADMYFQALNITGKWAEAAAEDKAGMQFSVSSPHEGKSTGWMSVGKVGLKVVWGRTSEDIHYLNVFARHLTDAGYSVGGLLGEDDHGKESTPPEYCKHSIALLYNEGGISEREGSIAEVM